LLDGVHDDADGANIVDLAERQILAVHLAVNAVDVLGTALDLGLQAFTCKLFLNIRNSSSQIDFAV
jgi:hypothetical protein